MYSVYVITNIVNAKQYIGITNNLKRRIKRHSAGVGETKLARAVCKYGWSSFIATEVACTKVWDFAKQIEKLLIKEHNTLNSGYNMTEGGDGTVGWHHTKDSKHKLQQSNVKAYQNKELRAAIGKKISLAKKGKPSSRKGIPSGKKGIAHSKEHANKIRESLNTPESKAKRSKTMKIALSKPEWKASQSAKIKASWVIRKAMQKDKETL